MKTLQEEVFELIMNRIGVADDEEFEAKTSTRRFSAHISFQNARCMSLVTVAIGMKFLHGTF